MGACSTFIFRIIPLDILGRVSGNYKYMSISWFNFKRYIKNKIFIIKGLNEITIHTFRN